MADKKRIEELMKGVTHPSRMKGRAPSPMPDYIRRIKEKEEKAKKEQLEKGSIPENLEQQEYSHSTGFAEEEAKEFKRATKVPKEVSEGLQKFLLKVQRIKSDPQKLAQFQELMAKEFTGDE